ncbi:2-dehydropantoate 2-reductase [Thalassorhabdus alkalitolerans]|uniref:2-dehydropantoate 2-reductase n=2 Tax=Thalassorhabdus alkalitolerans TaxID=2282697 RepID=A0ABW0YKK0_9BACI
MKMKAKVAIVGGGSVGLLLAGYTARIAETVLVCRRHSQKEMIERHGIHVQGQFTAEAEAVTWGEKKKAVEHADLIIIAVKSYDLEKIWKSLPEIKPGAGVLFLQNGMAHTPLLEQSQKQNVYHTFAGIVEHGALKVNDNTVKHTGQGILHIGAVTKESPLLQQMLHIFDEAGLAAKKIAHWKEKMEEKLLFNSVINPLTALFQVKNGELIDNPYFKKVMNQLFMEASSVLSLPHSPNLWHDLCSLCENTAENQSSMLRDVLHHRPTELDAITGYLVKKGESQRIPMPCHNFVYQSIKGLEKRRGGKWGMY